MREARFLGALLLETSLALAAPHVGAVTGVEDSAASVGFARIYALLTEHCGACHVRGQADGPWSLDTPPTAQRFPECLTVSSADQLRCATYHELVDVPAPGIPAWIRPAEGPESEPYSQACDPAVSFHIGHSLPSALVADDCARFLRWIEAGAPWEVGVP